MIKKAIKQNTPEEILNFKKIIEENGLNFFFKTHYIETIN